MTFSLVNVGRKPIIRSDIISPPTIRFPEGVNLLDFQIDQLFPPNLQVEHELNKTTRTLSLNFPLLNPEDSVRFSILLEGSIPKYQADARISNLKELLIADRTGELRKKRGGVPWTVYPVGFFALLFAAVAVSLFNDFKKKINQRRDYILAKNPLPHFETKKEYLGFINDVFSYMTDKKREPIINIINKIAEDSLTKNNQNDIEAAIIEFLEKDDGNLSGAIVSLCIFATGLWYVLSKVL